VVEAVLIVAPGGGRIWSGPPRRRCRVRVAQVGNVLCRPLAVGGQRASSGGCELPIRAAVHCQSVPRWGHQDASLRAWRIHMALVSLARKLVDDGPMKGETNGQSVKKGSPHLSRRQFLTFGLVGAGAISLSQRARSRAAVSGPNDRITLGFIGMGRQNRSLLGGFLRKAGTQVVAVCDVDTTRREDARQRVEQFYAQGKRSGTYHGCAAYRDFRELLARSDVDAVVIATPDHWHALQVVAAAAAGKDIYCEKPLSLTIAEARAMVTAVRRYDRVLQTGSQQRSSAEFRRACELVRNGRIGRVERVVVGVGGPSRWCDLPEEPLEPGLDWDLWLGPAPWRPYNSILSPRGVHDHFPHWRRYREYSGGAMTDWGAHHFDIAQWGLGMDGSGPVEVIPPDEPTSGTGVRFRYANGVEVVHDSSQGGVRFLGTDGWIFVDRGKFEAHPESVAIEPLGPGAVRLYYSDDHLQNWLDCIRTRRRPICDVEVGARSVTVCHLGNLAYWHGRRLRWDPERERFLGDQEANRWLDRPMRDPWKLVV
jgi:predicted dehydrogenase